MSALRTLLLLFAVAAMALPTAAEAQSLMPGMSESEVEAKPTLPPELTRQAIRDVLSEISDAEARELLLAELDRQVSAREAMLAAESERSLGQVVVGWATTLGRQFAFVITALPTVPGDFGIAVDRFVEARGDVGLWRLPGGLILCLFVGYLASLGAQRIVRPWELALQRERPECLIKRIGVLLGGVALQGSQLVAFVIAGFLTNKIANSSVPADATLIGGLVEAVGWTWFAGMFPSFMLAPKTPSLRLCAVDDKTAHFLTGRIIFVFGVSAFGWVLMDWLMTYGFSPVERIGWWFGALFNCAMALTIWQAREAITGIVMGDGSGGPRWHKFARAWPGIAIGLVMLNWAVANLIAAELGVGALSAQTLNLTLAIILALPLFEVAIPAVVHALWPDDPEQDPALRAAHAQTQAGLVRCAHIPVTAVLILFLAALWGIDMHDLANQGIGAQMFGTLMEITVTLLIAYGMWELVTILADRQIAIEQVALGIDPNAEEQQDGEGGRGGTRLGTLMPLIRGTVQVAIVILTTLAVLGQIGVNVTPLLAGAGILGLAIGFGAQTLVRDVLSGIFFLIDDAFRKGEYIEIGEITGTVENISIRSMQLRHHNGPLHTIPFGEVRHLTNYSRDWVMMKLPLRVTYDTDVEKLRKLVKKMGQELLDDPELGPKFLQPLKSQGVIQMDDSAMIVRVKFMTRPGDQWGVRTKVYAKIRELFAREGIKFAHREVTVRIANDSEERPLTDAERQAATAAARQVIEAEDPKPAAAEAR